jgi:hypothetical protein
MSNAASPAPWLKRSNLGHSSDQRICCARREKGYFDSNDSVIEGLAEILGKDLESSGSADAKEVVNCLEKISQVKQLVMVSTLPQIMALFDRVPDWSCQLSVACGMGGLSSHSLTELKTLTIL